MVEELGHPLIAEAKCVRNSVRLDRETRVLLVSGSNMSGKSTLLRVVGINTVLAMAGAPVRAKSLRLTPLAMWARAFTARIRCKKGARRFIPRSCTSGVSLTSRPMVRSHECQWRFGETEANLTTAILAAKTAAAVPV